MKEKKTGFLRALSVVLSLLMVLSVISLPTFKAKAAAGTLDDFIERCYTVTLDRPSDPVGFAYWKGRVLNGDAVGIEVAYGFMFSPEYTKKDKTNTEFVRDLYSLFMGRDPDDSGFNDWMNKLDEGASRQDVFAGFANSPEFFNICESYGITAGRYVKDCSRETNNKVNLFVERLYKICLGRIGDKGGQTNWAEKLMKKEISGSECARSFIFSPEYTNLDLSDEEFVENLYLAMFGRPSDVVGKSNWLYGLKNGMTRDEVFAGFANSIEFDGLCKIYGIDRGTYTAKDKGTFDEDDPNNEEPHFHIFNQKNTDEKYFKSAATCIKGAEYYYSCECGEIGSETFTYGDPDPDAHSYDSMANFRHFATATEDGYAMYGCLNGCGNVKTEEEYCGLSKAKVGDTIYYGWYDSYYVGENLWKDNIEWIVLSKENGRALVISKNILDVQPFDSSSGYITWEDSSLRQWLNDYFLNYTFSESERNHIPKVTIANDRNEYYRVSSGDDTQDQIFCLSVDEAEAYFGPYNEYDSEEMIGYNQKLLCTATSYATNKGLQYKYVDEDRYNSSMKNHGYTSDVISNSYGNWWLRTSGGHGAAVVSFAGTAGYKHCSEGNKTNIGVRPAMYLDYEEH